MFEVRIHGRGGQGVVTAAELLAEAAFQEGWHAQAFPSFGSERTGAPVVSFCRLSRGPIRVREPVLRAHAVVVQDATLLHQVDVFAGLRPEGYVLVNSARSPAELGLSEVADPRPGRVLTLPATELAREHIGRPMPNAVLLGGLAALTGLVHLSAVTGAITGRFPPGVAQANVAAATAAYKLVLSGLPEGQRAGQREGDRQEVAGA